jgi:hypothetical protein
MKRSRTQGMQGMSQTEQPIERVGLEPELSPFATPLQASVHATILELGGYWRALSSLARLGEEVGELADALRNDPDGVPGELADVFIVSTCLANQFELGLEIEYAARYLDPELQEVPIAPRHPSLMLDIVGAAGDVARAVNRIVGDKPPKRGETLRALEDVITDLHGCLAQFAVSNNIDLAACVRNQLEHTRVRDAERFPTQHRWSRFSGNDFPPPGR